MAKLTSLSPGQTLKNGQYTIERELGQGRFSINYLAHTVTGRVVIKVLDLNLLQSLTESERNRLETLFWQEAQKLSQCRGTAHIVKTELPFKEGDWVCLPMDWFQLSLCLDVL